MKIEAPGQMGTPTNTNYNNEPTSTSRRLFIDHLLFCEDGSYRRLLAWRIGPYLKRVGRLHLSFKCSGGCCEAVSPRTAADFLLSGKYADAWVRQG